jgi:tetratricopeptide (TPR) repeat protein
MLLAHRLRRPGLAAAGLAFAVLPKETGILGLALAPLLDVLTGGREELRRRLRDYALYAAVGALYLYIRFGPMKGPAGAADLSAVLPWTERLYYGVRIEYFALPPSSPLEYALWAAAAAAILAATFILAARLRRKNPALAFFLLWPLPVLFLTSNILPAAVLSLRLMAERWLYLPAAGLAVAAAWLLRGRPLRLRLLLVAWGLLGFLRVKDWSDEPRLWASLVRIYPWSAKAVEGYGEALFRAGRTAEAEASFEKGLALRQTRADLVLAHYVPLAPPGTIGWDSAPLDRWLGLCRLRRGDAPRAAAYFEKAVALQPSDVFSYRVLAYVAARAGDFASARTWLDRGLTRAPADPFLLRLKPDLAARRLTFAARFD